MARRATNRQAARRDRSAAGSRPDAVPPAQAASLDRLIHEPVRLGILSALAATGPMTFRELRDLLETTDGNLSIHARKLEDAGHLECSKNFEGRMPRTEFRITRSGRRALEDYITHMEAIIHAARQ